MRPDVLRSATDRRRFPGVSSGLLLVVAAVLLQSPGCSEARPPDISADDRGAWDETLFADSLRRVVILLDEVAPVLSDLSNQQRPPSPSESTRLTETLQQAEALVPAVPRHLPVLEFPNHHLAAGNLGPAIRSFDWARRSLAGDLDSGHQGAEEARFHLRQGIHSLERARGALQAIQNPGTASPAGERLDPAI
jgi:hypothetical protein